MIVASIVLAAAMASTGGALVVDFDKIFVEELRSRTLAFHKAGDDLYEVRLDGRELTINTRNIRAEVLRDQDPAAISRFLDHAMVPMPALPEWREASRHLFPMIESIEVELGPETVSTPLTDRTKLVLAFHPPGGASVRFVTAPDLAAWGVTADQAWEAARREFGKLVATTRIEVLNAGDLRLGTVHAAEPYKASMILSPNLKARIPPELGWPVLAVAPARDFVYLLRKDDEDELGRVGSVVVEEFRKSGYPVSTEVWELSDEGARAIGEFPVE